MWLRAFHLVSACVFSPRTASFTTADIRHTAKPLPSTLTVLRVHLPLCFYDTHMQPRSQPISHLLWHAHAWLFKTKKRRA